MEANSKSFTESNSCEQTDYTVNLLDIHFMHNYVLIRVHVYFSPPGGSIDNYKGFNTLFKESLTCARNSH